MNSKKLHKKIQNRKMLLNFLLYHFSPNNKLIIFLSQNLDKYLVKAQDKYLSSSLSEDTVLDPINLNITT